MTRLVRRGAVIAAALRLVRELGCAYQQGRTIGEHFGADDPATLLQYVTMRSMHPLRYCDCCDDAAPSDIAELLGVEEVA